MLQYNSDFTGLHTDLYDTRLTAIEDWKNNFLDNVYPIGAIYISTIATNPATLFGGTWILILDKFLLCAGNSYSAGSTGGTASLLHSHKYGVRLGGYYSETIFENNSGIDGAINWDTAGNKTTASFGSRIDTVTMTINGGSATSTTTANVARYELIGQSEYITQTNMPPYLAVYVWQRTA